MLCVYVVTTGTEPERHLWTLRSVSKTGCAQLPVRHDSQTYSWCVIVQHKEDCVLAHQQVCTKPDGRSQRRSPGLMGSLWLTKYVVGLGSIVRAIYDAIDEMCKSTQQSDSNMVVQI